jgi:hypothetical protein
MTEPFDRAQLSLIREDIDLATSHRSVTGIEAWLRTAKQAATLYDEVVRLRAVEAAAHEYADDLEGYCSPHGVSVDYAKELRERLKNAQPRLAEQRAQH